MYLDIKYFNKDHFIFIEINQLAFVYTFKTKKAWTEKKNVYV